MLYIKPSTVYSATTEGLAFACLTARLYAEAWIEQQLAEFYYSEAAPINEIPEEEGEILMP